MRLAHPSVLALLLSTPLLAGCLVADPDQGTSAPARSLLGGPDDVPRDAPSQGGPGPRALRIASVPFGDAIAVWWTEGDHLAVLHLRSREGGSDPISIDPAVAKVPANVAVRIVAGGDEWTQDAFVAAGTQDVLVDLATPEASGTVTGTWDEPATFGAAQPTWQPTRFPWADDETMARLASLDLELTWSNGVGGGADFGIAVGPNEDGGFRYNNGASQTSPGAQRETWSLGPDVFADLGWTSATRPQAGPSVSTGAFATTGIAYELAWVATFAPDLELARVCATLEGLQAVAVPAG